MHIYDKAQFHYYISMTFFKTKDFIKGSGYHPFSNYKYLYLILYSDDVNQFYGFLLK